MAAGYCHWHRMLLPLASYAKAIGIVCKNHWHRMLRPLALYANAGGIACKIAMHAAPRSCQSGPGEKACDRAGTVSCPVARIITCCRPTGGRARSLSQVMPADIRQCHHCRHSRCQHRERSQSTTTFITLRPLSDATLTIYMPSASDERSRSDTMLPAVIATIPPVV